MSNEITLAEPEAKIKEISKDLAVMTKKSEKLIIKTEKDLQKGTDSIVKLKVRINRIKELKKEYTTPFRKALKKLDELFNGPLRAYEAIEVVVKRSISDYVLKQEKIAQAAEEKAQKKLEEKNKKAEKAGEEIDYTPAPVADRPETTLRAKEGGTVSNVKVWKFEITDETKVPQAFLKVDEIKIRTAVRAGTREIPGIRIFQDIEVKVRT